jgi:hypothetical protein
MNFRPSLFGTTLACGLSALGGPLAAGSLEEVQEILKTLATGPYLGEVFRSPQDPEGCLRILGEGFGTDEKAVQVRLDGQLLPFKLMNDSHLVIQVPKNTPATARLQVWMGGRPSLAVPLGTPAVYQYAEQLLILPKEDPILLIETNHYHRPTPEGWRTRLSGNSVHLSTAHHNRMVRTAFGLSEEKEKAALTKALESTPPGLTGAWDLALDGKGAQPATDSKGARPATDNKGAQSATDSKGAQPATDSKIKGK